MVHEKTVPADVPCLFFKLKGEERFVGYFIACYFHGDICCVVTSACGVFAACVAFVSCVLKNNETFDWREKNYSPAITLTQKP